MKGEVSRPEHVVIIDAAMLYKAAKLVKSCEHCNQEAAGIPFVVILDRVTDSDPSVTDYKMEKPASCPNCQHDILEKTFIEAATGFSAGQATRAANTPR